MGWERKRGKLIEFNRLLREDSDTTYAWCSAPAQAVPRVRYVLTLDADTQLPRETARRLIGTLAHPLNRARFDPEQRRVVKGYGVLQPRVSFHYRVGLRSRFARIFAGSERDILRVSGTARTTIYGGDGDDSISLGANRGNDLIDAGAGDDGINAGGGRDTIVGGARNESEMGAFCCENVSLRKRGLAAKYEEYAPLGIYPVWIDAD